MTIYCACDGCTQPTKTDDVTGCCYPIYPVMSLDFINTLCNTNYTRAQLPSLPLGCWSSWIVSDNGCWVCFPNGVIWEADINGKCYTLNQETGKIEEIP